MAALLIAAVAAAVLVARAIERCRAQVGPSRVRIASDRAERLPLVYVDGRTLPPLGGYHFVLELPVWTT